MVPELPSNSRKAREQPDEKKIESVVTGKVVRRKKSPGKRFGELFVSGDSRTVTQYILMEVALPAIKDGFSDVATTWIEQMLYGDNRSRGRRPSNRPAATSAPSGYVSYNRYGSSTREEASRNRMSPQAKATHNFDEVVLTTRAEAEEVLNRMFDLIGRYELVSVADLYTLLDEPRSHTDEKWGWEDLTGAGVTRVRTGYLLDLPRPKVIE